MCLSHKSNLMAHMIIFKPLPLTPPVKLVYDATVYVPLGRRGSKISFSIECLLLEVFKPQCPCLETRGFSKEGGTRFGAEVPLG